MTIKCNTSHNYYKSELNHDPLLNEKILLKLDDASIQCISLHHKVQKPLSDMSSDGVNARASKAKAVVHKTKDKVIYRDQGLRQGHDEPTQYHFLWRKYLPVTNSVY